MFPGLSPQMQGAARQVMNGVAPNPNIYFARRKRFYHLQSVGASGFTTKDYFTASPSSLVTNVQQSGQFVSTEQFYVVHSIGVYFQSNGTNGVAVESGGNKPAALAEAIRRYVEEGYLTFSVNNREYVAQEPTIHFPAGGGAFAAFAAATTNSASDEWAALVNNGTPHSQNVYDTRPGIPVLPNYQIRARIEYAAAIAPPASSTLNLIVFTDGVLVEPANR